MKASLPAALLFVTAFFASSGGTRANDEALSLIVRDGGSISYLDLAPGLIALDAETAFPVLKDSRGNAVAAAGEAPAPGAARVVAFAHDGFLKNGPMLQQPANLGVVSNAIRWAGRSSKPKIALHPNLQSLAGPLREKGLEAEVVAPADLKAAGRPDVYCVIAQRGLTDADIDALLAAQAKGLGLVLAATPWPFAGDHPHFAEFPANRLAAAAGFRLTPDGYADREKPIAVSHANGAEILAALTELGRSPRQLDSARRDALLTTIREGVSLRGQPLTDFLTGLRALSEKAGPIVPTKESPVIPGQDPLIDTVIALEDTLNQTLPAGRMYPIAAANNYPGPVPADAPRIERTVRLDGTWRGWLSGRGAGAWAAKEMRPTGLYAAPGEVITVTAPESVAGRGFEIVIGAYGGGLSGRDQWHRYPRLQRAVTIEGPVTKISNALGGLITIRVPRGATSGELAFTLAGAIEAPLYIDGRTDLTEWRNRFRRAPAPWAEIAGSRIIIALPSELIRRLDDPDRVMKVWTEILDKAAELSGGVDRDQYRAERLVFDRQTAAGYMHSGYPVAAHLDDAAALSVDSRRLRSEGSWGFFHEYGHNHQHDLWSLPGTGETTCNLWSVYLFEEYIGKKRELGHDAVRPLDRRQRLNSYFQGGRNFDKDWSMWVALETYLQVQETFGWEPFKKVIAEYNALPESAWPRTQQEKNDQWVIRLSKACGKNLAPFWAAWNLPLSPAVAEALADLPVWEDHPVAKLAK
ncbi:MAG: hypothetical protein JNK37_14900 [Verrucomicrobiales bacterium]|nr:hypothetical protein [Verrucomicrobiales bacterium]